MQTSVKLRFVLKTHQTVRFHTAVFAVFPPSTLKDRKTLLSLKRNTAIAIICVCACYWMTSLCSKRFLSLFILIRRDCFFKCSSSKQRFQICGVIFSRTSQFFSILFERKMFVHSNTRSLSFPSGSVFCFHLSFSLLREYFHFAGMSGRFVTWGKRTQDYLCWCRVAKLESAKRWWGTGFSRCLVNDLQQNEKKLIRVQCCTVNDFTFPIVVNEPRSLFFRLYYSILNKPGVAPFFLARRPPRWTYP